MKIESEISCQRVYSCLFRNSSWLGTGHNLAGGVGRWKQWGGGGGGGGSHIF